MAARNETNAEYSLTVLTTFLQSEHNPSRVPNNFDKSLEIARLAPDGSCLKQCIDAGFYVWFAYFRAIETGIALALDELSPLELADVLKKVANVNPHPTIQLLKSKILQNADWRNQRRRGE
jgi:hypothetical protein